MENGKENIVMSKSYAFALRIVNLYKYLINEQKEYVLSKQILRSGTAIGALIFELVRLLARIVKTSKTNQLNK